MFAYSKRPQMKPCKVSDTTRLFVIKQHTDHTFPNGKTSPAHEGMPPAEELGVNGFSPNDLHSARDKFDLVVAREQAKNSKKGIVSS